MKRLESIEEFYRLRHQWIPDEIRSNLGHFNVFPLKYPAIGAGAEPLEYGRREWYNIVLVFEGGILQCAGKEYQVKDHAVAFTNPFTPFGWKERDQISRGYFCIFNEPFLKKDKRIINFPPFRSGLPFYELTTAEAATMESLFLRMFEEVNTDYIYKYDVLKLLVEDMLHLTMKSMKFEAATESSQTAAERITIQFIDLLERQFPIEKTTQTLRLRNASDFATQLNVHVNHLNRSVKAVTEKSTTQIIKERILQEAQTLIRLTDWNVADIAFALGFKESTHFSNFFKKETNLTPIQYRNY